MGLLPQAAIRSMPKNLPSAQAHQDVIGEYLQQQVQVGRILGPFHPKDCQGVILSSLGAIPGKFQVIVDLSSPREYSTVEPL